MALIGQCCEAAQVDRVIDPRLPVSQGMKTSDMVKAMIGLLSLGKSDFEAIEPFRTDRFFKEALGLSKVPSSAWMRQRLNAKDQGIDGHCPIAGYLGNEGWNVGLELRAGKWHCARQTEYFYERAFPRVRRLVKPKEVVLMVEDSGFDSARLLFAKTAERDAWTAEERGLEYDHNAADHVKVFVGLQERLLRVASP